MVNFNVLHRLLIQMMLDKDGKSGNHSLSELNQIFKILDKMNFKEDEIKELNIKNENGSIKWDNEKDTKKDIELGDKQIEILMDVFSRKDKMKEFDLQNFIGYREIAEQIGYKLE
mgnify:FL=1